MRGIDYSPAGIGKALFKMTKLIRTKDVKLQKQIAEELSRGTLGSSVIFGGGLLYGLKIIQGKKEKNKQVYEFRRDIGLDKYTLNTDALYRFVASGFNPELAKPQKGDNMQTYDWNQPLSTPFSMGANVKQGQDKGKINPLDLLGTAIISIESSSDTLATQPLLQGISNLFKYGDITEGIKETFKNMPASFIPTLSNQIRQIRDPHVRDTEAEEGSAIINKDVTDTINRIKNKLPVLSEGLPKFVSRIGKDAKYTTSNNVAKQIFDTFLSPSITKKYEETSGIKLVMDLYDKVGIPDPEKGIRYIPRKAPEKISIEYKDDNGKNQSLKIPLTKDNQAIMQKVMGEVSVKVLDKLASNQEFKNQDVKTQADIIEKILNEIGDESKNYMLKELLKQKAMKKK
jgi:hypothetical protein